MLCPVQSVILRFTGEVREGVSADDVAEFHEQLTRRWSSTSLVTGALLIISGQVAVHILEAPTPLLFEFLRCFLDDEEGDKILKNCRICSLTEEVPREFPVWGTRSVEVAKEEFQAPAIWLQSIFETHKNLLEMGHELASMEDGKALAYLQNADSRHFLQRIPSPDKIKAFKECEQLCTVAE